MAVLPALGWFATPARRRLAAAGIAAVLIAALFFAVQWYRQDAQEARAEAEVANSGVEVLETARASDDASAAALEASRIVITQTESKARVKTEEALAAHPEWADQPVPADVLGSLRE